MSCVVIRRATDEALLAAIAADPQNPGAWQALKSSCEPRLRNWLRLRHYYLPEDLFDDVLQETWLAVHTHVHKFDASRGTVKGWLFGLGRNAVKKVRRQYGIPDPERLEVPGAATENSDSPIRRYDLSIEEISEFDPGRVERHDPAESPENMVISDMQAEWLMTRAKMTASPDVVRALVLVGGGLSLNHAAAAVGVHRRSLTRRLRRWAHDEPSRSDPGAWVNDPFPRSEGLSRIDHLIVESHWLQNRGRR